MRTTGARAVVAATMAGWPHRHTATPLGSAPGPGAANPADPHDEYGKPRTRSQP